MYNILHNHPTFLLLFVLDPSQRLPNFDLLTSLNFPSPPTFDVLPSAFCWRLENKHNGASQCPPKILLAAM